MKTKFWLGIAFFILLLSVGSWQYGNHVAHEERWKIFEMPIRFENGFFLEKQFRVGQKAKCYLGIEPNFGSQPDEFEAKFIITWNDAVVAGGSNLAVQHATVRSGNHTARSIGTFEAEPGRTYDLFFRIKNAATRRPLKKPVLVTYIDPQISAPYYGRRANFRLISRALLLVDLVLISCVWLLRPRKQLDA